MNKIYTFFYRYTVGAHTNELRYDIELPAVNSSGYEYIAKKCAEHLCNYNSFLTKDDKCIEIDIYDGAVYINTFTVKITHPPVCTVISCLSEEEK